MRFHHKSASIKIKGIIPEITKCSPISAGKLKGLIKRHAISHCIQLTVSKHAQQSGSNSSSVCQLTEEIVQQAPPLVQSLLEKYTVIFQEPK